MTQHHRNSSAGNFALARYILALDSGLQALIATRQQGVNAWLAALDASSAVAAIHLPVCSPVGDTILLAASFAARLSRTAIFAEVDVATKHPVNVARALVSASHLSGHRIGWALSAVGEAAIRRQNRWLNRTAPPAGAPSIRQEFADLVIDLARSWPYESLIGDRERGWYNVAGSIRQIARTGHFSVSGSLNMPGVPYGALPFLSFDTDAELSGHLQIGPVLRHADEDNDNDVQLFPVVAPSNRGLGTSSVEGELYYVTGLRTLDQLSRLTRASNLAVPERQPRSGSIWQLLGVRPSVERLS